MMSILQLVLAASIVIIHIIFHLPACIHYYMKCPINIRGTEMRIEQNNSVLLREMVLSF